MPSTSNLFFRFIFSLVARCAEAKGKVSLFCCSACNAACVFFCPSGNRMRISMLLRSDKPKIFNLVVLSVFVYVVYMYAFWGVGHNAVLILPLVWLCCFHLNIHKPIARFVQSFTSNRKADTNFVQDLFANRFCLGSERFVRAIWASWRVVIGVAVGSFFPYDGSTAKRAWFRQKFFHARSVYQ